MKISGTNMRRLFEDFAISWPARRIEGTHKGPGPDFSTQTGATL